VDNGVVTKYYYAGGQRIAMRTGSALTYLLGDHLGSTSITTDSAGVKISELRYKPWGEVHYSWTNTPVTTPSYTLSKYTFTGQYSDSYINLLDYGSRRYDPELGRFIQPDSIVPVASQGVQAYDRYAYVNNNPVRYTDPSGHCISDPLSFMVCAMVAGAVIDAGVNAYSQYQKTGHIDGREVFDHAVEGAVIGGGVVIAGVVVIAAATTLLPVAATVETAACADGDCTNEVCALTSMAEKELESPPAQSLARTIANTATQNSKSPVVSLGSNGLYQRPGFTFFQLPDKTWSSLSSTGTKYVEAVNNQFINSQMNQGKEFGFTIDPVSGIGYYSKFEYEILATSTKYQEMVKDSFDYYFVPK